MYGAAEVCSQLLTPFSKPNLEVLRTFSHTDEAGF